MSVSQTLACQNQPSVHRLLGPTPRVSDSVSLNHTPQWGLKMCISDKPRGDAAGPETRDHALGTTAPGLVMVSDSVPCALQPAGPSLHSILSCYPPPT